MHPFFFTSIVTSPYERSFPERDVNQSINLSIKSINQTFYQSINLQSCRIKAHWRWLFIRVIMHLSNWCQYFTKSSPPLWRVDIPVFFRCFCLIIYQTMLKNFSKICKIIFQVSLSQFSVIKSKRKYIWICKCPSRISLKMPTNHALVNPEVIGRPKMKCYVLGWWKLGDTVKNKEHIAGPKNYWKNLCWVLFHITLCQFAFIKSTQTCSHWGHNLWFSSLINKDRRLEMVLNN